MSFTKEFLKPALLFKEIFMKMCAVGLKNDYTNNGQHIFLNSYLLVKGVKDGETIFTQKVVNSIDFSRFASTFC